MDAGTEPSLPLARKVLPPELLACLEHVFIQGIDGTVLAGGSSLAGFYAEHRKSDDLDFFTQDEEHQQTAVLAIESLPLIHAQLKSVQKTAQFSKYICTLHDYTFSITSVVDRNLFRIGGFKVLENKVKVVDLKTLLMMKASTLVSRCSEKDLYDLLWLFEQFPEVEIKEMIDLASEFDGGINGESLLIGISGATLNESACHFSLDPKIPAKEIYKKIADFQKMLILKIREFLRNEPVPPLGGLARELKKLWVGKGPDRRLKR